MLDPSHYQKELNNNLHCSAHIWTTQYSDHYSQLSLYQNLLTAPELTRAQRYIKTEDQHKAILGFAWRRLILASYLNSQPQDLYFDYTNGKPSLSNTALHFNITHSGNYWALAITNAPIGIDFEIATRKIDVQEIAQRFFTPLEYSRIKAASAPEQVFFKIWVAKEALLKAIGSGILAGLDQIEIPDYDATRQIILTQNQTWHLRGIALWQEGFSALATQQELNTIEIIKFARQS